MKRIFIRYKRWFVLAGGLIAFGLYLGVGVVRGYASLEMSERERLLVQSKVVEDNLIRQLTAVQYALNSIAGNLAHWAALYDGQQQAVRQLTGLEEAMPSVRTFLVLDAKGVVTLSNRSELMNRNFYERDYFQAPMRSLDPQALFVSPPFKSVLGNYLYNLSRVVLDEKGHFAGVVSAGIDPVDMEILLDSVRYAGDMRSMLVHGDGLVFVVQPPTPDLLGKNLAVPGSFFSLHMESKLPVNTFNGLAYSTGDQRLPVLRSIQPTSLKMDKPLVIVTSRHVPTLFAPWRKEAFEQLASYLALVLLSVAALSVFQRQRLQVQLADQRLKLATAAVGMGVWEFDLHTRCYHWDAAMFDLFGLDANQVGARNDDWLQLALPGELERIKAATRQAIELDQAFDLTFKIVRPDGAVRFMRSQARLFGDVPGESSRLIGTTEDITERKMIEADLRIAAIAFNSQEGMLVTDTELRILRVNRAFSDLFGYGEEEALGKTPRILQSGRHDKAFYAAMWADITADGAWQGEIWNRRKNGEIFPEWLTITAVVDDAGVVTHYVASHIDISLRKAAEDEIKHLAFYDPLTHLPNRRLLQERLKQALSQARRDGTLLALMYVDLDKFKPVNDQFGHAVGDQLLQAVARRMSTCVRESDTVARVGGDEFVLLLPSISSAVDAVLVAEKVHALLRNPFLLPDGHSVSISSSAGIALYPEHGIDEVTLSQTADTAMYQAKAAGRDRFVVFDATSAP